MLVFGLDGTILFVDVQSDAPFRAGTPRLLYKTRQDAIWATATSDFRRFIRVVPVGAAAPNSITVVVNWMAGLEKK